METPNPVYLNQKMQAIADALGSLLDEQQAARVRAVLAAVYNHR